MKNKKEKIWLTVLVLLVLSITFFVTTSSSEISEREKVSKEPITIGVLGPLSGVLARFGEWTERGASLVVEEINRSGGIDDREVRMIIEDDECSGSLAVSAVQKMQNVNNINFMVSFCTITSSAIAPVTKNRSVVMAPTFKLSQLKEADFPHYIAMQPTMLFESRKLFEHIESQGFKSIGILYTTNDFWTEYKNAFLQLAEEKDIRITAIEEADFQANDFRTQLSKIKVSDPDVIFGGLNPGPLGNMMKQKEELLIDVPVVSSWATQAPDLLERAGDASDGIVYTYYYENGFTERNERYVKLYEDKYNEEPELISASTYDAFFILKNAIESCGTEDLECVIDEIDSTEDYEGASGVMTFDNGTTIKDVFLKTVRNGEFVRY